MNLLVTGAAGFIGKRFCVMAGERGHTVTALVRPRMLPTHLPVHHVFHGQLPYDIPARALSKINCVVHCAAATTGQDDTESHAINFEGTRYLLERAAAAAVQRFVFLSSQSAHEQAVSSYGKTKLAAERLVRDSGIPYGILRPGLVFGPGRQGLFYRMRESVRKLPVLPLLGGGNAIVQAIEVSDLAEAMLRCIELPAAESIELNLGDPKGMPLREFLQEIATAGGGSRKPQISIPVGPIKAVVGAAEAVGLRLPISSQNLKGMQVVRRMETAESLEKIGLTLQPQAQAIRTAFAEERPSAVRHFSPVRTLLVGAGKIGIVHALNLYQREQNSLCGIVDQNPKAFGLYRSMGFAVPFMTDLDEAVERLKPEAAVIATPAATHLPLARRLGDRGLALFVEKPFCIAAGCLDEAATLSEMPNLICHVGYMAAQFPHLQTAKQMISAGDIGRPLRFHAFCLQSHIMAAKPVRWEMIREKSGGGVLINFAGHVLSMLLRLFGRPAHSEIAAWPIHSTEVEDAMEARFEYEQGFSGRMVGSWSIPGYPRPENRIVIEGESGEVVIENYCVSLRRNGKIEQVKTQLDYVIGFNSAPDYTGAGFSVEHMNFAEAVLAKREKREPIWKVAPPATLDEAVEIERLIFDLYGSVGNKRAPLENAPSGSAHDIEMNRILAELRR